MNLSMTALAQNSKICNFIKLMTFIYMMYVQFFVKSTYKTLSFISFKSSSPIHPLSVPIIWIILVDTFVRIKVNFSTFVRTKIRCIFFRFFDFIDRGTNFASKFYFCIPIITSIFPALSRAKVNSPRFILFDVPRTLVKSFFAPFAKKLNLHVTRFFITCSGAKSCSIFFKQNFAGRTLFHRSILLFANANVNLKEVTNGQV